MELWVWNFWQNYNKDSKGSQVYFMKIWLKRQCNPEAGFKNFLEKPPAEKEHLCVSVSQKHSIETIVSHLKNNKRNLIPNRIPHS